MDSARLIHCLVCNKTHAVLAGEAECASGAWLPKEAGTRIHCDDCKAPLGVVTEKNEVRRAVEGHRPECPGPAHCPVCYERVDLHTMDNETPPRIYCPYIEPTPGAQKGTP